MFRTDHDNTKYIKLCFEQLSVYHQKDCTSSLQYFFMHLYKQSSR